MDDLTEYLKRAKIKVIGFDYTDEEECLNTIRRSGSCIAYIENPTEEMKRISGKQHGYFITFRYLEEDLMKYIKDDSSYIRYINISKLTEEEKEILMYLV